MPSVQQLLNDPGLMAGMEFQARKEDKDRLIAKRDVLQAKADKAGETADKFLDDRDIPENMPVSDLLSIPEMSEYSDLEDKAEAAQLQADRLTDKEIERRAG